MWIRNVWSKFGICHFRNGRWRSQWTVSFDPSSTSENVDLKGVVKVQVHYYEDGNVQLVSSKDVKQTIQVTVSWTQTPIVKQLSTSLFAEWIALLILLSMFAGWVWIRFWVYKASGNRRKRISQCS
jgi:hypothetical protein